VEGFFIYRSLAVNLINYRKAFTAAFLESKHYHSIDIATFKSYADNAAIDISSILLI